MSGVELDVGIIAPPWSPDLAGEHILMPLNSTSQALEAFRVVKSGVGKLYGFQGFNNKASAQFIQVFDAGSLPADGAVPAFVLTAATVANFSAYFGSIGRSFYKGIVICNSSTLATKTIASADCFFDVQYA